MLIYLSLQKSHCLIESIVLTFTDIASDPDDANELRSILLGLESTCCFMSMAINRSVNKTDENNRIK